MRLRDKLITGFIIFVLVFLAILLNFDSLGLFFLGLVLWPIGVLLTILYSLLLLAVIFIAWKIIRWVIGKPKV